MHKKVSTLILLSALATACTTFKTYPTVLPLTEHEKANLSCIDIEGEFQKLAAVRAEIVKEDSDRYKTAVDFVTDLGIGNDITKKDLDKKIQARAGELKTLQAKRGC